MIVPHFMSYREIGEKAEEFLCKYHSSQKLPIPIERIIEFDLGLDIVPLPNLYTDFRINGFLSSDCSAIYIDERQYSLYPEKYRFTLAHEVGHLILHGDCYAEIRWENLSEYIECILSRDRETLDRLEVQGNLFAEQVLVPERELFRVIIECIGEHAKELAEIGASSRVALPYISKFISKHFEVNPSVIECRINHVEDWFSNLEYWSK